jgi:hypothetical protein
MIRTESRPTASRLDFTRRPTTIYWVAVKGYYSSILRRKTPSRKAKGKSEERERELRISFSTKSVKVICGIT